MLAVRQILLDLTKQIDHPNKLTYRLLRELFGKYSSPGDAVGKAEMQMPAGKFYKMVVDAGLVDDRITQVETRETYMVSIIFILKMAQVKARFCKFRPESGPDWHICPKFARASLEHEQIVQDGRRCGARR